ncbi:hypothetical protein BGZ83_007922 [Gryganskiella cystojenkinii]|nr:hypothetical protein BGZ83_007922 [Gryganskiella cystojenkinii]
MSWNTPPADTTAPPQGSWGSSAPATSGSWGSGAAEISDSSAGDSWAAKSKQMEDSFNTVPLTDSAPGEAHQRSSVPGEALSPTVTVEEAWPAFKVADGERDLDDVKPALALLCAAFQGRDWGAMEKKFREENCNTYLLASEDEVSFGYTLVNLKAEPGQRYRVLPSFIKPGTVKSGRMAIGMASSYEENFERLANAGVVRPSGIPRCLNCKEEGHVSNECPHDRVEPERSEYFMKCYNCSSQDHRTRNCPEPRKVMTCKNCNKEGHMARDCPDPPAPQICNRCGEEGHTQRECEQPRTDITCNRCGQPGHMSRDCDQPRTDITCNRCGEVGHMVRDCSQPRTDITCNRCGGVGHMSRDCDQPRMDITCKRCGQEGHMSRDCDQPRTDITCNKCGEPGHMARDCEQPEVCFNCQQPGHSSRDCDQPRQPRPASANRCYKCGESGHKSFDCPNEDASARRRAARFGFDHGF